MNNGDLRVIKTEQQIEQAFLQLLQQKSYRAITVQDILDTALINRSTFYRHYQSKAELAEYLVAQFRSQYETFLQKRFADTQSEDLLIFVNDFLKFLNGQKPKILALWQINTSNIHLHQDMYQLIKHQYQQYANYHQTPGNIDYQAHIYASLVLAHLRYSNRTIKMLQ